ncbi:ESX secretion-associated protein EspG [Nocardia sp. CA2R105]|uniref:ESX secretion-associated protein EspG n=1 Tax=Nocardia coffeae TaxID=2873381 RepID=UPI001CA7549C|nr:ESX secretion-associated protein EspG [Nocardia coffeae]MBY8855220.1 ESX secretion-associated protein EspG [Nocardia coffeae]
MSRTWTFAGFDFFVLWLDATDGPVPWPLAYTNRTKSQDEFRFVQRETRASLAEARDAEFDRMLAAITRPDIAVMLECADWRAWEKADWRVWGQPGELVRLYAARSGDRGYVISQQTGETYWDADGFTVTECDAIRLADAVVAAIPEADPGHISALVLAGENIGPGNSHEELDYSYGQSSVQDSFAESASDRAQRFLDAPTTYTGIVEVRQMRSIFGPRGRTKHRLEWRDLEDDGRYVIDDQTPPVATAVDNAKLIAMINTRVAAVVHAIKDERA